MPSVKALIPSPLARRGASTGTTRRTARGRSTRADAVRDGEQGRENGAREREVRRGCKLAGLLSSEAAVGRAGKAVGSRYSWLLQPSRQQSRTQRSRGERDVGL